MGEYELITFFYDKVFSAIASAIVDSVADLSGKLPDKGYSQVKQVITVILNFCSRAIASMRKSCMDPAVAKEHKLLSQMPIQGFLHMNGGLPAAIEQYAYVWFIGFVYRLRNALFHEIIDPLDVMWQQVFKNAYLVLKQIVDVNISRLQNVAELKKNSFSKYCCEFKAEPPPEIPIDDETTFGNDVVELERYDATGAKVHIGSTIKCKGVAYHVECDVNWDDTMKEAKVKEVKISKNESLPETA